MIVTVILYPPLCCKHYVQRRGVHLLNILIVDISWLTTISLLIYKTVCTIIVSTGRGEGKDTARRKGLIVGTVIRFRYRLQTNFADK